MPSPLSPARTTGTGRRRGDRQRGASGGDSRPFRSSAERTARFERPPGRRPPKPVSVVRERKECAGQGGSASRALPLGPRRVGAPAAPGPGDEGERGDRAALFPPRSPAGRGGPAMTARPAGTFGVRILTVSELTGRIREALRADAGLG